MARTACPCRATLRSPPPTALSGAASSPGVAHPRPAGSPPPAPARPGSASATARAPVLRPARGTGLRRYGPGCSPRRRQRPPHPARRRSRRNPSRSGRRAPSGDPLHGSAAAPPAQFGPIAIGRLHRADRRIRLRLGRRMDHAERHALPRFPRRSPPGPTARPTGSPGRPRAAARRPDAPPPDPAASPSIAVTKPSASAGHLAHHRGRGQPVRPAFDEIRRAALRRDHPAEHFGRRTRFPAPASIRPAPSSASAASPPSASASPPSATVRSHSAALTEVPVSVSITSITSSALPAAVASGCAHVGDQRRGHAARPLRRRDQRAGQRLGLAPCVFMKAPDPHFTSSTSASSPAASFFDRIEAVIRSMLSTVPVTSRIA